MECLRCGSKNLNKIKGISFNLDGVGREKGVGVTGIHCRKCGLLSLEMHPAAADVEVTEPIKDNQA